VSKPSIEEALVLLGAFSKCMEKRCRRSGERAADCGGRQRRNKTAWNRVPVGGRTRRLLDDLVRGGDGAARRAFGKRGLDLVGDGDKSTGPGVGFWIGGGGHR
jgi:hypothetical protein